MFVGSSNQNIVLTGKTNGKNHVTSIGFGCSNPFLSNGNTNIQEKTGADFLKHASFVSKKTGLHTMQTTSRSIWECHKHTKKEAATPREEA